MKMSTSVDPFAPPKRKRNTNEWLERAKLVVAAARDRAVEIAQLRETYRVAEAPLGSEVEREALTASGDAPFPGPRRLAKLLGG
jgi:hypothetical protein